MSTIDILKTQAKRLRIHLESKNTQCSHSQALEAIAAIHGFRDWNTASAKLKEADETPAKSPMRNNLGK